MSVRNRRRLITVVFAGAIVVAPFLALLYDVSFGLGVLAGALGVTTYLALDAGKAAPPEMRRRLMLLAGLNGGLTIIAAGLVVLRLIQ